MIIGGVIFILAVMSIAIEIMLMARIVGELKSSRYPGAPMTLIGIFGTIFIIGFTAYRMKVDMQSILTVCVILGGFIYSAVMNRIITYKTK